MVREKPNGILEGASANIRPLERDETMTLAELVAEKRGLAGLSWPAD